jgi:hypothetical protein
MQIPRPPGRVEVALQPGNPLTDQPPVDFELAFARAAEEAKPAALTLEMCPGAHQTGPLIGQCRQLDLQSALMGAGPLAENLQDQARPVDDLGLPTPFEIALLHRAQRSVDDDESNVVFADQLAEVFDSAAAEEAARARACDTDDLGTDYVQTDRLRETDRFFQPRFDRAAGDFSRVPSRCRFRDRMYDESPTCRARIGDPCGVCPVQDSAISFCSKSWIGCPGITVEIACLYTSCECASRRSKTQKLSNQVIIP